MFSQDLPSFWSAWVAVITLGVIFGCLWLIYVVRRSEPYKEETEHTMGHEFDGIAEYDNPLPRWWYMKFLLTIVFGLGYLALYPGLGNFQGLLGWTSTGQYETEIATAEQQYAPIFAAFRDQSVDELIADPSAMEVAGRLFSNNCAVCHGSAGQGAYGFPNLTDADWLYGGSAEKISETLHNGRLANMPAWLTILGDQGIEETAHYVVSLSGRAHDQTLATAGQVHYATYCAACHMPDGTGNQLLGAPNLTDDVWLYKAPNLTIHESVKLTLRNGRQGVMPSQARLGDDKIHLLTAYVRRLAESGSAQ
ncbi:MAG: cytochrome-c oxidase, cbb3-type subunit III [Gammaproteobacteria bacterium]|nr:cytochrome-c oxidase, cbb3-type subunit III [Gammaproteobacteria bacterium]